MSLYTHYMGAYNFSRYTGPVLTQVLSGGVRREGEPRCGASDVTRGEGGAPRCRGVTSRAGRGDPRRDRWTKGSARGGGIRGATDGRGGPRGERGSAARPMDEGSARGRGIRRRRTVRRCEKDSATCGRRIALSVRRGQCHKDVINVRQE